MVWTNPTSLRTCLRMETDEKAAAAGQAAFDCTVELKVDPAAPRSYRISVNC